MRNTALLRSAATTIQCALILACGGDPSSPSQATSRTGSIRVSLTLTGADFPPTYAVVVGGRTTSTRTDSAVTISNLLPGVYNVFVGVPSNCQATGANPRQVTVIAGEATAVAFSVTCAVATGALRVTTATTGVDIPNGYLVQVVGSMPSGQPYEWGVAIGTAETVTIRGVPLGNVRVTLAGLSLNCDVVGTNPRIVSVAAAETLAVKFDANCAAATGQLAYVNIASDGRSDIYLVNVNGTGTRRLTTDPAADSAPAWSPDGRRIAFTTDRDGNSEIYSIDADGVASARLTNEPRADYHPAWSPDGSRITFVSERDGNPEIYVMNADGTNPVRLTNHPFRDLDPTWSPDGRRIAFASDRDRSMDVYIMEADGSGVVRFTTTGARQPAWSPDGTKIAYAADYCPWYYTCPPSIFVKPLTGNPDRLSPTLGDRPSWSPDGRKVAYDGVECDFYYYECDRVGIRIARVDGSSIVGHVKGHSPAWRP